MVPTPGSVLTAPLPLSTVPEDPEAASDCTRLAKDDASDVMLPLSKAFPEASLSTVFRSAPDWTPRDAAADPSAAPRCLFSVMTSTTASVLPSALPISVARAWAWSAELAAAAVRTAT